MKDVFNKAANFIVTSTASVAAAVYAAPYGAHLAREMNALMEFGPHLATATLAAKLAVGATAAIAAYRASAYALNKLS